MRQPIDEKFDAILEGDPARAIAAWNKLKVKQMERGVCFGDKALPASLKPHFVPRSAHRRWIAATESLVSALGELGQLLLTDDDLYEKLKLPAGSRPLMDIDPGYQRIIVNCRPDFAWHRGVIHAYEVNTDSPAMMTFTDFLQDILEELYPLDAIAAEYSLTYFRRTQRMLEGMLEVYREWGGRSESPTIAIIDWRGQKTAQEQSATAARFTELGCPAFTCDPRELSISRGRLTAQGRAIDMVQRRVLFPDFVTRSVELEPLIRAYRDHVSCVVNPLRSYIAGNKVLLALLRDPAVVSRLSPAAQETAAEYVPRTRVLDDQIRREILNTRTTSVLKGAFSYGGHEVVIGRTVDDTAWENAVALTRNGQWVVQDYVQPPTCRVPRFGDSDALTFEELHANWNPFVFGGKFAGAMTRASGSLLVSITARGALLPSIEYDD